MLKCCLSYFLVTAVILLSASDVTATHIQFEQTKLYAEVSAKAQSEQKSFFVYFSASWCAPCQIMNRTAFKDENLANFIDDHVIPVKVDIDQTVGKLWQDEFNVVAIPTIIFFDEYGNEKDRITSGVSGTKLLSILSGLDPNHQPNNVDLPEATFVHYDVVDSYSSAITSDYKNSSYSNTNSTYKKFTTFELEIGYYVGESDYKFQMKALAGRYAEHRFYIIERRIPSGKTIYQLILGGFNNELEAQSEASYLEQKNYSPHLVKM